MESMKRRTERIINFANQIEKSSGKGFGEVIIGYQVSARSV